jgi:hypothetical protein
MTNPSTPTSSVSPFAALAASSARRPAPGPAATEPATANAPTNAQTGAQTDAAAAAPADAEREIAATATAPQAAPAPAEARATPAAALAESPAPGTALGAPAAEERKTLYVLTSSGDSRFDVILAGLVGHRDSGNCFQIDADYTRLSYLFTLGQGSSLPVLPNIPMGEAQDSEAINSGEVTIQRVGERVLAVTLPTSAAQAFKVNCVATASRGWSDMYHQKAKVLPAGMLGANVLEAERQRVASAVAAYVDEARLQTWQVPIIYTAMVYEEDPDYRGKTESELLGQASTPTNILPDITRPPVAREEVQDQTAAAHVVEGDGAAHQAMQVPIPADVAQHQGALELTIEGEISVRARSSDEAAQVATGLLMVASRVPRFAQMLEPVGNSIQHIRGFDGERDDGLTLRQMLGGQRGH